MLRRLLLALLSVMPAAAWAEAVVVSSTAPGMSVGRVLADDEIVHLPDATLTALLLSDGRIVKLYGPVDGRTGELAGTQTASAARVGGFGGVDLSALGGTRGELAALLPMVQDTVWVNPSRPGTWCVGPDSKVSAATEGVIEDPRTGQAVRLNAGQPWPAELPITEGALYMVKGAGPLRFHRVPAGANALTLATAGCLTQAGPPLREMGAKVTPFSLYLSTDRGVTPRYAIGEKVIVILQTNRPAHLACFLIKEGSATRLFPASGWIELRDHQELRIPGDRVAVQIAAEPPPGMGELRCHAVDAAKTPPILDTPSTAQAVETAFKPLPEAALASAHVFIRVQ